MGLALAAPFLFTSEQVALMKCLTAFLDKTTDTASIALCLLPTKPSTTAVLSLLTSPFVVDGMKIVEN